MPIPLPPGFEHNNKVVIKKYNMPPGIAYKVKQKVPTETRTDMSPLATVGEENLTELHKKTLASYIKKASKNASGYAADAGVLSGEAGVRAEHERLRSLGKANKRHRGIEKAANKLAEEAHHPDKEFPTHGAWLKHMKSLGMHIETEQDDPDENGQYHNYHVASKGNHIHGVSFPHKKIHVYHKKPMYEEVEIMTRFVDLAFNKQAADFNTQLESVMRSKVGTLLEVNKQSIAASMMEDKVKKFPGDEDEDPEKPVGNDAPGQKKAAAETEGKDVDEAINWNNVGLVEAIGHIKAGAFHRWLGKSEDKPITDADIKKGLDAGGHAAKMANFARNARHWKH